jgi:c-di-GMP-binding flagellar brake protein YcgR
MPLESEPLQRRNAVRQPVAVVPDRAQITYGGVACRPLRLGVIDLSATGLSVRSRDELRAGDLLELAFHLDGEELYVQARVRRVVRRERVWDVGCAFEGISERQAERIVKFIFVQQRAMLRARSEGAER